MPEVDYRNACARSGGQAARSLESKWIGRSRAQSTSDPRQCDESPGRLVDFYPQLPLFQEQGLAVTPMSGLDRIRFGLIGDWDALPDLADLPAALDESFAELIARAQRER